MTDLERALSEIANIRAQLAASTRFEGIGPEANVLAGMAALAVAAAQVVWPDLLAHDALHYVAVWGAVLIASTVIVAIETASRTRRLHGDMADVLLATALRQALPFAAAGIIVTAVICKLAPTSLWIVPGLWQLLIGLLGFSVLNSLPPAIVWVAGWYFASGVAVLCLAGWSGTLSPWMMGLPLAIGQSAVAVILHNASEARDGRV